VAGGGFHPRNVLPIALDVGTNNQKLIEDPDYHGVRAPRLEGKEYYEFVDEFITAVRNRYPDVLI
jgi:malate dehydrogenase (oxaloacetate-decarboxylating)